MLYSRRAMKVFDTEEQAIINKITQGHGYSRTLINILDSINNLQGTRIEIEIADRKARFLFQTQSSDPTDEECRFGIEKQQQLTELLIKHVTLFRYLEKEELAVFFEPTKNTEKTVRFGMGATNLPSFSMSIDDQNVVDLLIKYINKEIMPSPSLRDLENNNFLSDDTIKLKKQLVATWSAITVSIFLGLYGMYNNHQNSVNQEKQFKTQIIENKKTINAILKQIEKSKLDYTVSIDKVSKELSNIVDLMPRIQTVKVKPLNDSKVTEK